MNELSYFYKKIARIILLWISLLFIAFTFVIKNANAELANVNIVIKANIVANTCRVSPDSINKFVDLGTWATKNFKQNNMTDPVKFTLNLTDCSVVTKGVKVTFNGDVNGTDNSLFKLVGNNSATNVGIAILDKNKSKVLPGKGSIMYPTGANNTITLDFYAYYQAINEFVTSGSANSEVVFTLEYL
ncbi:TPA: type 1 fimbrial protein [Serratia marcescens]|uniref:fimbrial protein n=1 Tax=Proteus TaxID=583 RepID=UPI000D687DD7|nr:MULTISPECIES: fimbrial protein [Proteus]MBQ0214410.1 type 1 fimbrial protein [Proteus vulgaris]HEM7578071.1 type 1 fimbrial protein [Serratia marcescens]